MWHRKARRCQLAMFCIVSWQTLKRSAHVVCHATNVAFAVSARTHTSSSLSIFNVEWRQDTIHVTSRNLVEGLRKTRPRYPVSLQRHEPGYLSKTGPRGHYFHQAAAFFDTCHEFPVTRGGARHMYPETRQRHELGTYQNRSTALSVEVPRS
jgi:hypothetical protein